MHNKKRGNMTEHIKRGFGFGLTSGVITTLGIIVGLDVATGSKFTVIVGILAIAISDSLADAMGIHIAEEATLKRTTKQIWEATFATFFFKLVFALSFLIPFFVLELYPAVIACIIWGSILITTYSYYLAKMQKVASYKEIIEHLAITFAVIAAAYLVGRAATILIA